MFLYSKGFAATAGHDEWGPDFSLPWRFDSILLRCEQRTIHARPGFIDRAHSADSVHYLWREGMRVIRIQLINIKPVSLPILVQAEAEIEVRLSFEPGNMG